MRILNNTGTDRVVDLVRPHLANGARLDLVTPAWSLLAFAELRDELRSLQGVRVVLLAKGADLELLGSAADRAARNRLQSRWLAAQCASWLREKAELRNAHGPIPQGTAVIRDGAEAPTQVVLGSFAFSTQGLGITPGNPLSLIQASEGIEESTALSGWFDALSFSEHAQDPRLFGGQRVRFTIEFCSARLSDVKSEPILLCFCCFVR